MNDKVNRGLARMLDRQAKTQENQEDQSRVWDLAQATVAGAAWLQSGRVSASCAADTTAASASHPIAKNPLVKQQLNRYASEGFKAYKAALLDEKSYLDPSGSAVASILKKAADGAFFLIPAAVTVLGELLRVNYLTRYKEAITHAAEDALHAGEKAAAAGFQPKG